MTKCSVCNGTEFEVECGSRICSECGSHEVNFLELEDGEAAFEVRSPVNYKRLRIGRVVSPKSDIIKEEWLSFEAMNTILLEWTNSLIHLGLSEKLRETVMILWILYLRKRNIAFKTGSPEANHGRGAVDILPLRDVTILRNIEIQRVSKKRKTEKLLSDLERVQNKVRMKKLRCSKKSNLTGFLAYQLSNTLDAPQIENGEDDKESDVDANYERFFLKDDKMEASTFVEEAVSNKSEPSGRKVEVMSAKKRVLAVGPAQFTQTTRFHPANLTFHKLLSILYLSLLICGEDILVLELLRWCREGHVPYFSAIYLLDPKMKMCFGDCTFLFNQYLPTTDIVFYTCGQMAAYLCLQIVPLPSLKKIMAKLTHALNLPDDIAADALRCAELFLESSNSSKVLVLPNLEVHCAVSIILMFKLTYGLDGQQEHLNSLFAQKVNKIMKKEGSSWRLFSWIKWQRYLNRMNWWISEVDVLRMAPSNHCTNINADRFAQYFWTQGIWTNVDRDHDSISKWEKLLAEYLLEIGNKDITKVMSEEPLFRAPTLSMRDQVAQYVKEAHLRDPSFSKDLFLKIAKELNSADFSSHNIHRSNNLRVIGEFRKINKTLLLKYASMNVKKDVFRATKELATQPVDPPGLDFEIVDGSIVDSKSVTLVLPDTLKDFWIFNYQKVEDMENLSNFYPSNFIWLVKQLSTICETSIESILSKYAQLEGIYLKRISAKRNKKKRARIV